MTEVGSILPFGSLSFANTLMTTEEFENQLIPLAGAVTQYLKGLCRDQHLVEGIVAGVKYYIKETNPTAFRKPAAAKGKSG